MSRRPVTKPIHYVRATYNPNSAPKGTLESLLRRAMRRLGSMQETEIAMSHLGVVSVRHRKVSTGEPVQLAIGAGTPGEHMTTMGLRVIGEYDTDKTSNPPNDRAFKLSDAYLLIEGNDILLITDGHIRAPSVAAYLRALLDKADLEAAASAFELKKVTNQEKQRVLATEGIKEIHLKTNMYRATHDLDFVADARPSGLGARMKGFISIVKDLFAEEAQNSSEQKLQELAENWDHLQVSTVIKAEGGSRAEQIVLETMEAVGSDVLDELSDGVDVTVITLKGTKIHMSEVTPVKKAKLFRRDNANDLMHLEVFKVLRDYRTDLLNKRGWGI